MADRSSIFTKRERSAAINALGNQLLHGYSSAKLGAVVDAVAKTFGMRLEGSEPQQRQYQTLDSAPHDRDVILHKPNGQEVRACWWNSWADPSDDRPWAWRIARPDGTVGEPVDEATGWREVDR